MSVRHSDTKSRELTSRWNSRPQLLIQAFSNCKKENVSLGVSNDMYLLLCFHNAIPTHPAQVNYLHV